jgi:hypothetical protein
MRRGSAAVDGRLAPVQGPASLAWGLVRWMRAMGTEGPSAHGRGHGRGRAVRLTGSASPMPNVPAAEEFEAARACVHSAPQSFPKGPEG